MDLTPGSDWIGRTISHYLVEKRLGAGGMGEVYLVHDLALGRVAALKILPKGFSPSLRTRFLHEAKSNTLLQHPAIATFFEAGESQGTTFIAMEYVAGQTLRQRLRAGPIPPSQAISLTACLLEALGHAHAAGILHRDIKPENIMITGENSAKLLDFGLAKQMVAGMKTEDPTATVLTREGMILGTWGYMSPEQVKGETLDVRSDLFSVGAVLYEAVSGRPAFAGATPAERVAALLSRAPLPLSGVDIPPELGHVVQRVLSRERARRYPSAAEFLSDLRQLSSGEFVADLPETLAVMDLKNLSGNPDDEWIGSGIAESLAADLTRVPGLHLVAREKVLKARAALRDTHQSSDALDLGLALGCRWVFSGSFQRMGPALRVTENLTEVSTGRMVSAEKVDGTVDQIFAIQDRLSAAAVASLNLRIPAPTPTPSSTPKLKAYECYARGRRFYSRLEKGSFDQARELYDQAVAADPSYAPAFAGLAGVHALRFTFTTDPIELETAAGFARRAIELDPKLSEPHIWLGYVLIRQGKPSEAWEEEQKAMEIDPTNVFGPYFAACALFCALRRPEALSYFQRAVEIDPQHGWSWLGLGWTHLELDRPSEARWSLGRAVEMEKRGRESPTAGVSGYLGECLRRTGDFPGARTCCLDGLREVEKSDHMYRDSFRGVCLCALGRTALQQGDLTAARAAFGQAVSHLRGRPRALGAGHLLVQALAGLSRAGEGSKPYREALRLFERRTKFDFSWLWTCSDDVSLLELARAAASCGHPEQARDLQKRAREAGSTEAPGEKMS